MSQDLSQALHLPCVPEYARTYVQQLSRPYTLEDVFAIARHQIEELRHFSAAVFDTDLILTKVWLLHKYHVCPDWVNQAIEQYPMSHYLLCYPDLPWQPDSTRENPHIRQELFNQYLSLVQATRIPFTIIRGTGPTRFHQATAFLTH